MIRPTHGCSDAHRELGSVAAAVRHRVRGSDQTWQDGPDLRAVLAGTLRHPGSLGALMQRWRARGPEVLDGVRGDFTLVVCDGETWHLARDGAGVRTLYWAEVEGALVYAVEPKGVLAHPAFRPSIRPGGVAQYLSYSFIPGSPTLLDGLNELRPGHRLEWRQGHPVQEHRWHRFECAEPVLGRSDGQWVAQFREDVQAAISERLPSTGPIGVFLSGGIDSSVVAAELVQMCDRPIHTYTLHFGAQYPNELAYARAVADQLGTIHHEVLVSPSAFLPKMPEITWHLDDPIGDPIAVPNFELAARAAQDVDVIFNGEGGDPCFGGPKNVSMMLRHLYASPVPRRRERWYLESYRRSYEELDHLLTPDWRQAVDVERDLEGVLTPFFETDTPSGFLEKLLVINIRLKGGHLILPKVDRMLGAHGLQPLAPLFDERMLHLATALPGHLKLAQGVEKIVIKRAYRDRLPDEVIDRPKSGMRVPVHAWFLREMAEYARSVLDSQECRDAGIFEPGRVEELLRYDAGRAGGRYGLRLWMLMTFELWRRAHVR